MQANRNLPAAPMCTLPLIWRALHNGHQDPARPFLTTRFNSTMVYQGSGHGNIVVTLNPHINQDPSSLSKSLFRRMPSSYKAEVLQVRHQCHLTGMACSLQHHNIKTMPEPVLPKPSLGSFVRDGLKDKTSADYMDGLPPVYAA